LATPELKGKCSCLIWETHQACQQLCDSSLIWSDKIRVIYKLIKTTRISISKTS